MMQYDVFQILDWMREGKVGMDNRGAYFSGQHSGHIFTLGIIYLEAYG